MKPTTIFASMMLAVISSVASGQQPKQSPPLSSQLPEGAIVHRDLPYVTKDDPPFLIVHGDSDPLVPHHQSELLAAALEKAGIPTTFYTVKGGGHGNFKDPVVPEMTKKFFANYLKK